VSLGGTFSHEGENAAMKIYLPTCAENAEFCLPVDRGGFDHLREYLIGGPEAPRWKPLRIRIVREDEGVPLTHSDAPWFSSDVLALSERAIDALEPLLTQNGELLRLNCSDRPLWAFNPTLIDALDVERSTVRRFSTGKIMMIQKYVFFPDAIGPAAAFKIPNRRASPTFLEHALVERWRSAGLVGLEFEQIWPCEQ
jgi:hypothetical protein